MYPDFILTSFKTCFASTVFFTQNIRQSWFYIGIWLETYSRGFQRTPHVRRSFQFQPLLSITQQLVTYFCDLLFVINDILSKNEYWRNIQCLVPNYSVWALYLTPWDVESNSDFYYFYIIAHLQFTKPISSAEICCFRFIIPHKRKWKSELVFEC